MSIVFEKNAKNLYVVSVLTTKVQDCGSSKPAVINGKLKDGAFAADFVRVFDKTGEREFFCITGIKKSPKLPYSGCAKTVKNRLIIVSDIYKLTNLRYNEIKRC